MGSETLYEFTRRLVRESKWLQKVLMILTYASLIVLVSALILQGTLHSTSVLVDVLQTIILSLTLLLTIPQLIITPYTEYLKVLEERRYRHWSRLREALIVPLAKLILHESRFRESFEAGCYLPVCSMLRRLMIDHGLQPYYEDLGNHEATRGLYEALRSLCGPLDHVCGSGLDAEIEDLVEAALREAGIDPGKPPGPAVEEAVRCAIHVAAPQAAAFMRGEDWLRALKQRIVDELTRTMPSCTTTDVTVVGDPLLPREKAEEIAERIVEKIRKSHLHERLKELYRKLREELNRALLYETLTDDCPYTLPEAKKSKKR
ncbi:hypothetical protein Pyrfu_0326 [Pyrolobus fumarii 1A]|uniref:Uncharacterized protein n=1 Tax=Pyrolobus fumarii (strain DSM 11204 / 1A) TaxID=694429 RepID=G0EFM7_PYRF1|nr:hypothetical protein [Pyrolobus fumarii]AEM38198.1 hypothetical protein Pyrfu_0326 [Pyrolobus fumarii 1A]